MIINGININHFISKNNNLTFASILYLPILLISGDQDPVSNFGEGVVELCHNYLRHNIKDVDIKGDIHNDVDDKFSEFYKLQSPDEVLKNKIGVCWDQVELERYWFKKHGYEIKTIYEMVKLNFKKKYRINDSEWKEATSNKEKISIFTA